MSESDRNSAEARDNGVIDSVDPSAVWDMPFNDVLAIAEDLENPLHEIAARVADEAVAPLALMQGTQQALAAIADRWGEGVPAGALANAAAIAHAAAESAYVPRLPPWVDRLGSVASAAQGGKLRPWPSSRSTPLAVVDFESDEVPEASAAEVRAAADVVAAERHEAMLKVQSEALALAGRQLAQMESDANERKKASKPAWIAAWAGIAAGAIGIGGIVVTLLRS